MNNLSWMLYWADTLPQLSTWLCLTAFLLTIIFGFALVLGVTDFFGGVSEIKQRYDHKSDEYVKYEKTYSDLAALALRLRRIGLLAPVFFLLWGASFLVPSKDTFYLIAASEAGEQALQTPEFGKVRQVINKWLDDEIAPLPPEKKED